MASASRRQHLRGHVRASVEGRSRARQALKKAMTATSIPNPTTTRPTQQRPLPRPRKQLLQTVCGGGCAMQQAVRLSAVLSFEGKEEAHVDLAQVAVETAMKEAPGRLQDAALECGRNLMLPLHGVGATASLSVLKQLIPLLLQSTPLHGAPRAAGRARAPRARGAGRRRACRHHLRLGRSC